MSDCPKCADPTGMALNCVGCCVRWLSTMTHEEMKANAPIIQAAMGLEHMNEVRRVWKSNQPAKDVS